MQMQIHSQGQPEVTPGEPAAGAPPSQAPERGPRSGLTPFSLFLVLLIAYVLIKVKLVLILTLLSILFATIVERPVQLLERRRVPRGVGILLVYAAIIGGVALLTALLAPGISHEGRTFANEAPGQLATLQTKWQASSSPLLNGPGQRFLGKAIEAIDKPPVPKGAAVTALTKVGTGVVGLLAVLVIAFYYLMEKALIRRLVLLELRPGSRTRAARVWDDVEAKVGAWLRGQLFLCLIIGVTATIAFGILGIRFWPLLGILAGVTGLIPLIGPWLGGVPAVVIALTQSFEKALLVVVFILIRQFLSDFVLVPRIMRGAVGLTPLTVVVAVLAGTEFIGPAGALLAIPIAAAVQVIVADYLDSRRDAKRGVELPAPGWRWMRGYLQAGPSPAPPNPTPSEPTRIAPATTPQDTPPPSLGERSRWPGARVERRGDPAAAAVPDDDNAAVPASAGTPPG